MILIIGAIFYNMKTKRALFFASPCSAALVTHSAARAFAAIDGLALNEHAHSAMADILL